MRERFENFNALLLADRKVTHQGRRVDRDAKAVRVLFHLALELLRIEDETARLTESQVLGDCQSGHQGEMLGDHADAVLNGVMRRTDGHPAAIDQNLPLIGVIEAVKDSH